MQVAFFLPQLVQQLREDQGGLVEEFLLAAAARSMLFAHVLLCALRVCSCLPGPRSTVAPAQKTEWPGIPSN